MKWNVEKYIMCGEEKQDLVNRISELVEALNGLVGATGLHEDDCECDNTHEQHDTVCLYCYARQVLNKYQD